MRVFTCSLEKSNMLENKGWTGNLTNNLVATIKFFFLLSQQLYIEYLLWARHLPRYWDKVRQHEVSAFEKLIVLWVDSHLTKKYMYK